MIYELFRPLVRVYIVVVILWVWVWMENENIFQCILILWFVSSSMLYSHNYLTLRLTTYLSQTNATDNLSVIPVEMLEPLFRIKRRENCRGLKLQLILHPSFPAYYYSINNTQEDNQMCNDNNSYWWSVQCLRILPLCPSFLDWLFSKAYN